MDNTEKKILTTDEGYQLAKKHERMLKSITFMDFVGSSKKPPEINVYHDEDMYFDPQSREIHIGSDGVRFYEPTDEESFVTAQEYVRRHEMGHVLYTATKPYENGIRLGVRAVIEYIASVEDPGMRFKTEASYEKYCNELKNKGIYLDWKMLKEMVAGIENSLEDGRIEGISAKKSDYAKKLIILHRGIFWETSDYDYIDYPDLNSGEKLRVIVNQILCLATCQLYQKGFYLKYADTPLIDEVRDLMENIGRAVISRSTRGMADQCVEICRKLAPLMYEVFKMSSEDMEMRKVLEEIIKSLIEAAIETEIQKGLGDAKVNEEQDGISMPEPLFGSSNLEITLSDEEFDKLEKQMKEEGEDISKGGIKVKREHPKDEDGKEESESSSSSGKSGENEEKDESEKTSGGSADEKSDKNSNEDTKEENGKSSDNKSSSNQSQKGNMNELDEKGRKGGPDLDKSPEDIRAEINADVVSKVKEVMEKAAQNTRSVAEESISNVNSSNNREKKRISKKEKVSKNKPIDKAFVKEICSNFVELKRAYKVKDRMPPVLEARCQNMYRKNKRYFKSLSTPNINNLDSGSVDPSQIYSLGFGNTEVFRRIGKDKKFDGCAYILLDNSGSMSGNKRMEAAKASAVIEAGFNNIIPIKIVAFDSNYCNIVHEVIKDWKESLHYNCCWNFALHGREGSGNEDGYDIQIATKELLQRPERKKLLVVLSDGAPGNAELVKESVRKARNKGIEVYSIYFEEGGVGIHSDTFKYMYEKDYVCCELSDVDENLSKLFKRFSRN